MEICAWHPGGPSQHTWSGQVSKHSATRRESRVISPDTCDFLYLLSSCSILVPSHIRVLLRVDTCHCLALTYLSLFHEKDDISNISMHQILFYLYPGIENTSLLSFNLYNKIQALCSGPCGVCICCRKCSTTSRRRRTSASSRAWPASCSPAGECASLLGCSAGGGSLLEGSFRVMDDSCIQNFGGLCI